MKINDDVILDLLIPYFEGDASQSTQSIVDKYFEENPDFAKNMKSMHNKMQLSFEKRMADQTVVDNKPDEQLLTLKRTKKQLQIRTILLVLAILSALIPFVLVTFFHTEWMKPILVFIYVFLVPPLWIGYFIMRFRMRTKGIWS